MSAKQVNKKNIQLGEETPERNEAETAAKIVKLLQAQMLRFYDKNTKQLRQIHPKMNGCVKAEFIVENDLPDDLKVGLFKEAESYQAWVRFSNGNSKPLPDWKKDIRGFAIKIMDVPGKKIVESKTGEGNQDFILMNTENFVAKKVHKFYEILKVVTTPWKAGSVPSKIFTLLGCSPILLRAAKAKINCDNPFKLSYYSTVPYRFGAENKAVKYAVLPAKTNQSQGTDKSSPNFLRANMVETLNEYEIVYDFFVQFQTDPIAMPIEDPTITWNSPLMKVASIHIPTQIFDTDERNEFGDNLSFNAWHTLPEHRPIGNFNRVRKKIYEEMYKFRHEHNQIKDVEPKGNVQFFQDTNIIQHG